VHATRGRVLQYTRCTRSRRRRTKIRVIIIIVTMFFFPFALNDSIRLIDDLGRLVFRQWSHFYPLFPVPSIDGSPPRRPFVDEITDPSIKKQNQTLPVDRTSQVFLAPAAAARHTGYEREDEEDDDDGWFMRTHANRGIIPPPPRPSSFPSSIFNPPADRASPTQFIQTAPSPRPFARAIVWAAAVDAPASFRATLRPAGAVFAVVFVLVVIVTVRFSFDFRF